MARYDRAFALGISLNVAFIVIECVYGVLAGSLALVADAIHNTSDVLGLLLAWGATGLARRSPTHRRTYGFRRAPIVASLLSAIVLVVGVGAMIWEAVGRLGTDRPVHSMTIIVVAAIGIAINGATALLFVKGRKDDLNIRGAFLHMAADAAVSFGVVMAGVTILMTGWSWLDPVVSVAIGLLILIGTWSLLKESLDLVFDAVPRGVNISAVRGYLGALPGVASFHDLHVWGLSTTQCALTVHLVMPESSADDRFLHSVSRELHDRFGIEHATIQVERGEGGCSLESPRCT
jgi:cobalt-zinc-cadmium efflux system protein